MLDTHSFRTRSGYEIDFIFKIAKQPFVIECKATSKPNSDDVRSLKNVGSYFPRTTRAFLMHLGKEKRKIDGVWALPWQDALKEMGL